MLQISVNPSTTPPADLRRLVVFLCSYLSPTDAADVVSRLQRVAAGTMVSRDGHGGADVPGELRAVSKILDPLDNPESGEFAQSPEAAFGNQGPSAEAAFGAGGPSPEQAFAGNASAPAATGAPIAPPPVGSSVPQPPASGASVPPAPPASGVDLDKTGLPWDARIHAKAATGGGTKNADGTWRQKRGLNDGALVARIEAELRAVQAAPGPVAAGNVAPVPPAPSVVPVAPVPPVPGAVGGQLPTAPVAPPPTGNYVELVQLIAAQMGAGKLTEAEVAAACAAVGVPSLPLLATRLDLVLSVSQAINAAIAAKG